MSLSESDEKLWKAVTVFIYVVAICFPILTIAAIIKMLFS